MKKLLLALSLLLITGCTSQINFPDETATPEVNEPTPTPQTGEIHYDSEGTPMFAFHEDTNRIELLYIPPEYESFSLEEKWLFIYHMTVGFCHAGGAQTAASAHDEQFLQFFSSNGEIFESINVFGFFEDEIEGFKVSDIINSGVIDEDLGYMHNVSWYMELLEEATALIPTN